MSKEFIWTDELVVEFTSWSLKDSPTFQGRYADLEQFKQSKSIPEQKEWQILSFKHRRDGEFWELQDSGFYMWGVHMVGYNALIAENKIHSVKRLIDSEIFSVWDKVMDGTTERYLISFEINNMFDSGMAVYLSGRGDNRTAFSIIEKLHPTPQPEQPKRIQVAGIQQMNKYYPHSKPFENWFKFLIMDEDISPEKYPAIKSALEAVLNNDEQKSDLPKCAICGGATVLIRGKYPGCDKRNVCPQCTTERLEQIEQIANPNYGQTCKA